MYFIADLEGFVKLSNTICWKLSERISFSYEPLLLSYIIIITRRKEKSKMYLLEGMENFYSDFSYIENLPNLGKNGFHSLFHINALMH